MQVEPTFEAMQAALAVMRTAIKTARVAPSLEARKRDLDKLEEVILARKEDIAQAISKDFGGRSRHESLMAEVFIVLAGLRHVRAHMGEWAASEDRDVNVVCLPARAELRMQPLGIVGIIAPWNYPFQLALAPLVTAIAAGNRVMVKPSEITEHTSAVIVEILSAVFPEEQVAVIRGGVQVAQDFARLAFDHLLFTGSGNVGKLVMRAAAENLVPVTLELGGKSPVILGEDFPLEVAAERVMHGKLLNGGQTCIAPDYVLVPKSREEALVSALQAAAKKLYPTFVGNPDYTSLIHRKHRDRLRTYLSDAETKGAKVTPLSKEHVPDDGCTMIPCLVQNTTDDMLVSQEEIFGPILPIKTYGELSEAIEHVNMHPRPLAMYLFDNDPECVERVLNETVAGGVTVNDTLLHMAQDALPFGGVGASGMGHYHGKEGFQTFSKAKPIFFQSRLNTTGFLRPPYTGTTDFILNRLI